MNDNILFPEWRNSQEHVNYPFADGATLVNVDGKALDGDLFDDARVWIIGSAASLYLKRIYIIDTEVRFYFANADGIELAYGTFDPASIPVTGEVPIVDLYGRSSGILISTSSKLAAVIGQYPAGSTEFPPEASTLAASVVVPLPELGVRGFVLDDGNAVFGTTFIMGDNGIVLSEEDGALRVDAVGDAYANHARCLEQDPIVPFCGVKTINYINPDVNRDFKFYPGGNAALDNIFRVELEGAVLRISSVKALGLNNG